MGLIWNLLKTNFFGNLARIFSLVRGRLCICTAFFRIFSLVLHCVESYTHCFITLPALRFNISSSVTGSPFKWIQKALLIRETLAIWTASGKLCFQWRIFLKDWLDCSTIARSVLSREQCNTIIIWIGKVLTTMQIRGSSNVFDLKSATWSTMRGGGRCRVAMEWGWDSQYRLSEHFNF